MLKEFPSTTPDSPDDLVTEQLDRFTSVAERTIGVRAERVRLNDGDGWLDLTGPLEVILEVILRFDIASRMSCEFRAAEHDEYTVRFAHDDNEHAFRGVDAFEGA